jgi:hypothetical protein
VSPIQAPSPRVAPRLNPVHVASPRVNHTLPRNSTIPLTPHPAAAISPYVPQGMAGVNLFVTLEEKHMETPSLPRYNARAMARQRAINQDHYLTPCVFCPITFTNAQVFHAAPKKAINHIPMANDVINQDTGASLEYHQLTQDEPAFPVWNKEAATEFVRLAQGVVGTIEGSNTIFFIPRQAILKGKIVTDGRFVVDIHTNKTETHRVRLNVGGNLIQYPGDVSTRSGDLTTSKCLCNSTISTEGSTYMCLDVKNFNLGIPMDSIDNMRIPIKCIPQYIIAEYNLLSLVSYVHVYIEVQKGMYGLPQAIILAIQLLSHGLAMYGFLCTSWLIYLVSWAWAVNDTYNRKTLVFICRSVSYPISSFSKSVVL